MLKMNPVLDAAALAAWGLEAAAAVAAAVTNKGLQLKHLLEAQQVAQDMENQVQAMQIALEHDVQAEVEQADAAVEAARVALEEATEVRDRAVHIFQSFEQMYEADGEP